MFVENKLENPVKEYINRWKGKHPTPYDFFFTMDNLFGEDLSWFWKPWYFEFRSPDLSIAEVIKASDKTTIVIKNPGGLPLPVYVTSYFENGKINKMSKSAYIWRGNTSEVRLEIFSGDPINKIVLGHDNIPDVNPGNNIWVKEISE